MLFAYSIFLTPLLVCLGLLFFCAFTRARHGRLPRVWRRVAGYGAFFAALYVPVIYFFCDQIGHYDSHAEVKRVPVTPALFRAGFIPRNSLPPAGRRQPAAVAP